MMPPRTYLLPPVDLEAWMEVRNVAEWKRKLIRAETRRAAHQLAVDIERRDIYGGQA